MNFNQEERKQKLLYLQRDNGNGTMGHYNLLLIGIFIFFMIIMGRVWYLQVIKYDYFKELSEKNRIHKREIKAPRGIIFDRNGKIVADNRPQFIARYTNPIQGISDESINKLSSILGIDIEQLNKRISEASYTPLKSITLKEDLNRKAVAVLKENNFLFSGVTVETEPIRYYNFAGVGAHVIGHMGKLTKEDIHRVDGSEYCIDDWIGKTGIERVHEQHIKGKQGGVLIEVNALGQKLKTLEKTDYIAGNNLQLTIDMDLEMSCQEMLQGKKGAIVVMNPQNGEILAMVSSPTYDSNMFTKGMRHDEWRQLDEKKKLPFLNRAIQGMYPPGSLFKVVTAVAALENRVTNENRTIYSTGEFHYGNQVFRDWKEDGHGVTNLKKAIACSVNTYFFQIGLEAGIKNIYTYAIDFGLGKKTGIELIGEKEGLIPNPDWMRVHNKKPWYPGDTINLSIGQGLVLVTPLQMANMYCSIANGGILFKPRLVKAITTTDGEVLHRFLPEVERNLTVSKKTLEVIKNCLREVIKTGTGKAAFAGFPVKVVGKTGSAQNPGGKPHAWFVGFAPYHEPSIVVAVLVEHGEHGAGIGAGIALKTFQLLCEKGLLASSMQKRASYA